MIDKANNLIKYNEYDITIEDIKEGSDFVTDSTEDLANIENYSNLGHFLIAFFKYYAREFDNENKGLSLYIKRFGKELLLRENAINNGICVESMQGEWVNLGEKCLKYNEIKSLFNKVYIKIEAICQLDLPSNLNILDLSVK